MRWHARYMALGLLVTISVAVAACSGRTTTTLSGVLVEEGGPRPGGHTLVAGEIKLSAASGTFSASAGHNGRFSVAVPVGTYTVQGRPAHWPLPGYPCGGQKVFVPSTGKTIQTTVVCTFP